MTCPPLDAVLFDAGGTLVRLDFEWMSAEVTALGFGLHHAAGQSPEIIIEIHGNVRDAKCMSCDWRGPMHETLERVRAGEDDPRCTVCGGILKSATISFGENLVAADLQRSQATARRADVFSSCSESSG